MCEEYVAGRLDNVEIAYIATAIELCPDFVMSERIREAGEYLAEFSTDSPLTSDQVSEISRSLWQSAQRTATRRPAPPSRGTGRNR